VAEVLCTETGVEAEAEVDGGAVEAEADEEEMGVGCEGGVCANALNGGWEAAVGM
jgi:hypothetical protein